MFMETSVIGLGNFSARPCGLGLMVYVNKLEDIVEAMACVKLMNSVHCGCKDDILCPFVVISCIVQHKIQCAIIFRAASHKIPFEEDDTACLPWINGSSIDFHVVQKDPPYYNRYACAICKSSTRESMELNALNTAAIMINGNHYWSSTQFKKDVAERYKYLINKNYGLILEDDPNENIQIHNSKSASFVPFKVPNFEKPSELFASFNVSTQGWVEMKNRCALKTF